MHRRQTTEEKRRAHSSELSVPLAAKAAALAVQREEEQRATLAHAKAVEEREEAIRAYASIKLQRLKEASDAHARLLLLCHPVELLPFRSGIMPVVIPSVLPLYKVVAVNKAGALVSVFSGQEQYRLDKWTLAKHGGASWPPVYACSSAFATPMEAIAEQFPPNSNMLKAPKMLVKLDALGQAYYHEKSKTWALSKARVAALLTQLSPHATLDVHWALNGPQDPLTAPLTEHVREPPLVSTTTASLAPHTAAAVQTTVAQPPDTTGLHATTSQQDMVSPTGAAAHTVEGSSTRQQPQQQDTITDNQGQQYQRTSNLSIPPSQSLSLKERHTDSSPRVSALSIEHVHPSNTPSPTTCISRQHPTYIPTNIDSTYRAGASSAVSLPPRFDNTYKHHTYHDPIQPDQLVARYSPSSPRSLASREPSPPRPTYNPAAGSSTGKPMPQQLQHQSLDQTSSYSRLPPSHLQHLSASRPAYPSSVNQIHVADRDPSPPPQPRALPASLLQPKMSTSHASSSLYPQQSSSGAHSGSTKTTLQHTAAKLTPPPFHRRPSNQPPQQAYQSIEEYVEQALSDKPPPLSWSEFES